MDFAVSGPSGTHSAAGHFESVSFFGIKVQTETILLSISFEIRISNDSSKEVIPDDH